MAQGYPETEADFVSMQQEAINRVRQMQERARRTLENAGLHIENSEHEQEPPAHAAAAATESRNAQAEHHQAETNQPFQSMLQKLGFPFGGIHNLKLPFFDITFDEEQIMLILLIIFLYNDDADQWLVLSLVYILFT